MWICFNLLTKSILLLTDDVLLRVIYFQMVLSRCLASLCEGAFVVFMTGLIGMLSLCIFGNAFSVGLICFRYNAFLGGYVLYIIYTFASLSKLTNR